tara:strand:- start:379 stop:1563 length:1185 start_codon:yes stop_codon:yes gene_type:complete
MELNINRAVALHQEGRLEEAEKLYQEILRIQPTNLIANNNLGLLLHGLGKFDKALASYKKAIEVKPNYQLAHNNLGIVLHDLGRFHEAEISYRKAIELKSDYVEAHSNLGNVLKDLKRLNEAEASHRKAIEFKSDYAEAHYNLGITLRILGRFHEAEISYKKAIELKSDYVDAHNNLAVLLKEKKLLSKIEQAKKSEIKTKISSTKKVRTELFKSDFRLTFNPFISNRKVEKELINQIYKINSKKLDDVDPEYLRYGNGRSSDYELFENDFSNIKTLEKDLIDIMKEAVKSDIFIMESFFNIFKTGSGIISHNHITSFDDYSGLHDQKFSLAYYLDIGDQNCSKPGILKLEDPDKEILPIKGMITIFPASRRHSATYDGGKDRVMIGVNFYSLL